MMEIAKELQGVVMGDEGETYRDFDQPGVCSPPYFNPNNLSNAWEEPPLDYAERASPSDRTVPPNAGELVRKDWTLGKLATAALVILVVATFLGNALFALVKLIFDR
jgi:hypothetical protein